MMEGIRRLACVFLIWSCGQAIAESGHECPDGVLGVVAQVVRIDPAHARVSKTLATGSEQAVGVNGVLCAGESVHLAPAGTVTRVELYSGGRRQSLEAGQTFSTAKGEVRLDPRVTRYLAEIAAANGGLKPPPEIPSPSTPRSAGSSQPSARFQIQAMHLLQKLPRQLITPDVRPVVSWREGFGPYVCQAVSEAQDVLWEEPRAETASWCAFLGGQGAAHQLLVRESRGRVVIWNVRWVSWEDVPRPEWLRGRQGRGSSVDQTAWATWLWSQGAGEWRLQALGMLNEHSGKEWLAGYLRDTLLSDGSLPAVR